MTDKKKKILDTALELFANDGFNATSTSKIARQSGVSEGLIFKHFANKKALLDAILKKAESKINLYFAPILEEEDPRFVIQKFIELPFTVEETEYDFWRLQFKLKWEPAYYYPEKMQPIEEKLTWAFKELNYVEPSHEAKFLSQVMDTMAVGILRDGLATQRPIKDLLLKKYH